MTTTPTYRIPIVVLMIAVCGAASHIRSGASTEQQALLEVGVTTTKKSSAATKSNYRMGNLVRKGPGQPNFAVPEKADRDWGVSNKKSDCKTFFNPGTCSKCLEYYESGSLPEAGEGHGCAWCYNEEGATGPADGACRDSVHACGDTQEFFRIHGTHLSSDRSYDTKISEAQKERIGVSKYYTTFKHILPDDLGPSVMNPDPCGRAQIQDKVELNIKEQAMVLGLAEKDYKKFWTTTRKGIRVKGSMKASMDEERKNQHNTGPFSSRAFSLSHYEDEFSEGRYEELKEQIAEEEKAAEAAQAKAAQEKVRMDEAERAEAVRAEAERAEEAEDKARKDKAAEDEKAAVEKKAAIDKQAEELQKQVREDEAAQEKARIDTAAEEERAAVEKKAAEEERAAVEKKAAEEEEEMRRLESEEEEKRKTKAAEDEMHESEAEEAAAEQAKIEAIPEDAEEEKKRQKKRITGCISFKEDGKGCCTSMSKLEFKERFICKLTAFGTSTKKTCTSFGQNVNADNLCPAILVAEGEIDSENVYEEFRKDKENELKQWEEDQKNKGVAFITQY